jgi:hypothetical protein
MAFCGVVPFRTTLSVACHTPGDAIELPVPLLPLCDAITAEEHDTLVALERQKARLMP